MATKIFDLSKLSPSPVFTWEETRAILNQFVNVNNNRLNSNISKDFFVKKHSGLL